MKELKIEVPQGYEIDKENSTFECIKFKRECDIKTWDDYMFIEKANWGIMKKTADRIFNLECALNQMFNKKHTNRIIAEYKISILINYYGGSITYDEWVDKAIQKFTIKRVNNLVNFDITTREYNLLAFRTHQQRNDFYDNNKQLVEDYLMIR